MKLGVHIENSIPDNCVVIPQGVQGLTDIVRNPIYATGVGLLQYGLLHQEDGSTPTRGVGTSNESVFARFKNWISSNF